MLLGILALALLLRLAAACGLQYLLDFRWHRPFLISGDAEGYWMLAQKIVAGEAYAIYDPPRYALRMPGFPAVLAIPVAIFGPKLFAARLFLALVGTVACALVFRLGRQMFEVRVGLIAAALCAISPVLVGFTVTVLSETTFAVTLLWSLCAGHQLYQLLHIPEGMMHPEPKCPIEHQPNENWLVDFRNRPGYRAGMIFGMAIVTGVAIAAGVMMRPSWILAAPIVALLLVLTTQQRLKAALAGGVIILAMGLALLPWGLRNQRVTGHFTLTTFWMGPSLYDGLNPQATGDSNMVFYDRDQLMLTMSEYDVDQHYRAEAWKFARENPGRAVQLAGAKLLRYWSPWPNAAQFGQWWAKLVVSLFFIPTFCLAVWGGYLLFRPADEMGKMVRPGCLSSQFWSLAILAGPVLYFSLIHMFFVSSLRYRLPAEYPLLILTAFGLVQWSGQRIARRT